MTLSAGNRPINFLVGATADWCPSGYTTGERRRTGSISKTRNAHLRRVVVEAAWAYRWRPAVRYELRKRHAGLNPGVTDIARKAQHRLHRRFQRMLARGKN